jgi:hypothetical protein
MEARAERGLIILIWHNVGLLMGVILGVGRHFACISAGSPVEGMQEKWHGVMELLRVSLFRALVNYGV